MRGLGILALVWVAFCGPSIAKEVVIDGRVSVRSLYSTDDDALTDAVGITFLRANAQVQNLTEGGLRLILDSTFVLDSTQSNERRFGQQESIDQVRQLYLEQPKVMGALDVTVGRKLLANAGNAWVDGLDLELWLDNRRISIGAFGGLSPGHIDYSLTTNYQTAGAYTTLNRDGLDLALAYNAVLFQGVMDRQYVFNRLHYKLAEGLFVGNYLVLDFIKKAELTTMLTSIDYSPLTNLKLTLNYSRSSIEQFRNQAIYRNIIEPNQALRLGDEVVDLVYNRFRFSSLLRFGGQYAAFSSLEFKHRSQDGKEAWLYTVGFRNHNLMGWGTRVDLRATLRNNFVSDSMLLALNVRQNIGGSVTIAGRATWLSGRTIGPNTVQNRVFDEAQQIYLFGTTLSWRPVAGHSLDLDYDGVLETELIDIRNENKEVLIQTVMGRYSYLF